MQANQQLVSYIQDALQSGANPETIFNALVNHGWSMQDVDLAFRVLNLTPPNLQYTTQQSGPGAQTPPTSRQYRLRAGLKDTFERTRKNATSVILALIIALIVNLIPIVFLLVLATGSLLTPLGSLIFNPKPAQIITIAVGFFILFITITTLIGSLIQSLVSHSLYADHFKIQSRKGFISPAISATPRVLVGNLLFYLYAFAPSLLSLVITTPFVLQRSTLLLIVIPIGIGATVVWPIIALLKFALVPYVAMFERDISTTKLFARSNSLMKNGAKWYLVKGFLLLIFASFCASMILNIDILPLTILLNAVFLSLYYLLTIGAGLMLYFNQRRYTH